MASSEDPAPRGTPSAAAGNGSAGFPFGQQAIANADRAKRGNVAGVRAYNERLILSLVRRHENLSKADISRATGLSAQTISVIARALEADALLLRMPPQRGRVGQPHVPLKINPDGAYAMGLKIGRRSADLVLMDFVGRIRRTLHWTYPSPTPADLLDKLAEGIGTLTRSLGEEERRRVAGLGVATPYELWNWAEHVGGQPGGLDAWRELDIEAEIKARCPVPVFLSNDGTAACGAELTFGRGREYPDFIYFFVGSFVGGGVVLGGTLYPGRTGNAGAVGSMPIPAAGGGSRQLIGPASLIGLEKRLAQEGGDSSSIFAAPADWQSIGAPLDDWIEEAARGLAYAIAAAVAVIDFGAVVIDGGFPPDIRRRLVARTEQCLGEIDLRGLAPFSVVEGSVGTNARAIGAATLPFFARYLLDRDLLFKDEI